MKLTASQQHNLDALYAAGGRLFHEHFKFSSALGGRPIRGLNARTMDRLVQMGLVKLEIHNELHDKPPQVVSDIHGHVIPCNQEQGHADEQVERQS